MKGPSSKAQGENGLHLLKAPEADEQDRQGPQAAGARLEAGDTVALEQVQTAVRHEAAHGLGLGDALELLLRELLLDQTELVEGPGDGPGRVHRGHRADEEGQQGHRPEDGDGREERGAGVGRVADVVLELLEQDDVHGFDEGSLSLPKCGGEAGVDAGGDREIQQQLLS